MSTQPKTFVTAQDYLEIERKAERKSEYFAGGMFAMARGKEAHNLLVINMAGELRDQLRRRPCRVYANDMRVRVSPGGLYTYPDVISVCGTPQFLDEERDTLLNPRLVVEVLSPSTEGYDRGRKFELYRSLESLREYVLVASDRVRVDVHSRQSDGRWLLTSASDLQDSVELQALECRISLDALYEKVELGADHTLRP